MSSSLALKRIALAFPGQGSQRVGMGTDLVNSGISIAKHVFEEVDETLGYSLSKIMAEGPIEELNRTSNTQPAILANSIAYYESAKHLYPELFSSGIITCSLGHSLGEYTALVTSGSMQLKDAVRAVHLRGDAMQRAADEYNGETGMVALLKFDVSTLPVFESELARIAHDTGGVCNVANINSDQQIVISGSSDALQLAVGVAKRNHKVRRASPLPVSAPFHCPIMNPVIHELDDLFSSSRMIGDTKGFPVISNVNGSALSQSSEIQQLILEQVTAPVQWRDCVKAIDLLETSYVVEFGSNVLTGLSRQIEHASTQQWASIASLDDISTLPTYFRNVL